MQGAISEHEVTDDVQLGAESAACRSPIHGIHAELIGKITWRRPATARVDQTRCS